MMRVEDDASRTCPCEGCTNPRDPIYGLCRRCRGIVCKHRLDGIYDLYERVTHAPNVYAKDKAVAAWNAGIDDVAADANAWRDRCAAR